MRSAAPADEQYGMQHNKRYMDSDFDAWYKRLGRFLGGWLLFASATSLLLAGFAALPARGAEGDGVLDLTFGDGGVVITDIGAHDFAHALAIQWDGKIIIAGTSGSSENWKGRDFALARYNADGSLDPTFGADGVVRTSLSAETDVAQALALQQDGKIVVGGYSGYADDPFKPGGLDLALARYDSDGSLDGTFGAGGTVTTDLGGHEYGNAVALQPDGKIVLAGYTMRARQDEGEIVVARYDGDGTPDPGFGANGVVRTRVGRRAQARALTLQPDGKLIVAGNARYAGSDDLQVAIVRYHPDGRLDDDFGNGGVVTTDLTGSWDTAYAIAVQSDGKIVVAGAAGTPPRLDVMLARFTSRGGLDPGFGNGGKIVADLSGSNDAALAIAVQADGKVSVAGYGVFDSPNRDVVVARFTGDGRLDKDFGEAGVAVIDFGGDDWAASLIQQRDGRLVAAGSSGLSKGKGSDVAIARFQGDTTYGPPYVWLPVIMKKLWR
jgi:uncharacterized delta-60 repeat protein